MKKFDVAEFDRNMAVDSAGAGDIVYHDVDAPGFRLDGLIFRHACNGAFRRLPLDPALPEAVNELAWHTAGAQLSFRSTSRKVLVRAKLRNRSWMDHMAMTGIFGFDLYVGGPGKYRFQGVTRFPVDAWEYECELYSCDTAMEREFLINFPLYSGVETVAIGLERGATISAPQPWRDPRPVVVYGTSITQGGCASRPGMAYTNILSRYYNRPFLNFGFSGSGKGEPEVVRHLASITDPALFLLGYEANAGAAGIRDTLDRTLSILRERHPSTPILVISRLRQNWEIRDSGSPLIRAREAVESVDFQRNLVDRHRQNGDENIYFIDGGTLSGRDWEENTVDGCHPTDLGFYRVAEGLISALDVLLNKERVSE